MEATEEFPEGETVVPLIELKRWRQLARTAVGGGIGDVLTFRLTKPTVKPTRFTVAEINPDPALEELGHLRMAPGWTLLGISELVGGNGCGVVFAVREHERREATRWLFKVCEAGEVSIEELRDGERKPPKSISVVMNAVEGPPTPESFVQASLLFRELLEYGASWHDIYWGDKYLIDLPPWEEGWDPDTVIRGRERSVTMSSPSEARNALELEVMRGPGYWKAKGELPDHFRPVVIRRGSEVTVRFSTYGERYRVHVLTHEDRYDFSSPMRTPARSGIVFRAATLRQSGFLY